MALILPQATKIAGVTYSNQDGTSRQDILSLTSVGEQLFLVDEYSEKYPEAIGVYNCVNEKLGSLPAAFAAQLRESYPDFDGLVCVVRFVGGKDGGPLGIQMVIGESRDQALSLFTPGEMEEVEAYVASAKAAAAKARERVQADAPKPEPEPAPAMPAKAAKPKRRGKLRWILILIALFILFLIIAPKK